MTHVFWEVIQVEFYKMQFIIRSSRIIIWHNTTSFVKAINRSAHKYLRFKIKYNMNRRVNNADITGFYLNIPNHNLKSFKLRFDNGN